MKNCETHVSRAYKVVFLHRVKSAIVCKNVEERENSWISLVLTSKINAKYSWAISKRVCSKPRVTFRKFNFLGWNCNVKINIDPPRLPAMRNMKKATYDELHSWQYLNNIKSKIIRRSGHMHHSKVSRGEKLTQSSCGQILGESSEELVEDGRIS